MTFKYFRSKKGDGIYISCFKKDKQVPFVSFYCRDPYIFEDISLYLFSYLKSRNYIWYESYPHDEGYIELKKSYIQISRAEAINYLLKLGIGEKVPPRLSNWQKIFNNFN